MWEGFDEWAHFAYIQHLADTGSLPLRTDPISPELLSSLRLVPLSKSAAQPIAGSITHEAFWRLPQSDRDEREARVRARVAAFPGDGIIAEGAASARQYEAQQPPLYYAMLAPAYMTLRPLSLPARVVALRVISVVIASAVVFVSYALARLLLPGPEFAVLMPVLVTSLPGLFISVCRVGNESLSVVLCATVLTFMVKATRARCGMRVWGTLGLVLGAALLTKAYSLSFLPLLPLVAWLSIARRRHDRKEVLGGISVALGVALSVAGWWYGREWITTGTLTGEQLDVAASLDRTLRGKLSAVGQVDWWSVVDAAAFTHIWVGGWSFLTARSWMYRVCEIATAIASLGVAVFLVRFGEFLRSARRPGASGAGIVVVLVFYLSLCAAVAYHALVVRLAGGMSTALGWYLYGAVAAEVLLIAVGLVALLGVRYARIAVGCLCVLACALDLYTTHFLLMPFYSGLSPHYLEQIRYGANVNLLFARLAINEAKAISPAVIAFVWAGYLCAMAALVAIAVRTAHAGRSRRLAAPALKARPSRIRPE